MILPPQQQNRSYNLNINQAKGVVVLGTNFLTHRVHHFQVFEADKECNKSEAEQLNHSHCEKQ
jgi:antitoxin component of MazEF toxin-antitoxin module